MEQPLRRCLIRSIAELLLLACLMPPPNGYAISSNNYKIEEDFLGGGGHTQSSSASFQAEDTLGATAAGEAVGALFKAFSGATTTSDPSLSFIVETSNVNLGALSTSLARTGTATFSTLNYTSYGYNVQTIGNPPDNGSHTLTAMAGGVSQTNTEQFGINLVANTSPATLGADPLQLPDSATSFGVAAPGYSTANNYKYASGDTIASAPKSSGKTTYTISYIANISNNTPGGSYSGKQTLICIGTY